MAPGGWCLGKGRDYNSCPERVEMAGWLIDDDGGGGGGVSTLPEISDSASSATAERFVGEYKIELHSAVCGCSFNSPPRERTHASRPTDQVDHTPHSLSAALPPHNNKRTD